MLPSLAWIDLTVKASTTSSDRTSAAYATTMFIITVFSASRAGVAQEVAEKWPLLPCQTADNGRRYTRSVVKA